MNINNLNANQGDLIRDLAEVRVREIHPAAAEFYIENKPNWMAGYDPTNDLFWCLPETADGETLDLAHWWPKSPWLRSGVLAWNWSEFQAYKREKEQPLRRRET